jgi:hypothetical protein
MLKNEINKFNFNLNNFLLKEIYLAKIKKKKNLKQPVLLLKSQKSPIKSGKTISNDEAKKQILKKIKKSSKLGRTS